MGKKSPDQIVKEVFGGPAANAAAPAIQATQNFVETQAANAPVKEDPTDPPAVEEVRVEASQEQRKYLNRRRASSTLLSGIGNALDTPKTASSVLLGV